MNELALELQDIEVSFGATRALSGVSIGLERGRIVGLVGANGAGKSTLIRVIEGDLRPQAGFVKVGGIEREEFSIPSGIRDGVAVVRQQLDLVPDLTVGENIALGAERAFLRGGLFSRKAAYARARDLLATVGLTSVDPAARLGDLSLGHQQLVAVARAIRSEPRVLLLDEPTTMLTPVESGQMLDTIAAMGRQGLSIVLVSHRLDDVMRTASSVIVLRDGVIAAHLAESNLSVRTIVEAMGGTLAAPRPRGAAPHPATGESPALEVDALVTRAGGPASFVLGRGEVLGLFGLVGAGQAELIRALSGVDRPASGIIRVDGREVSPRSPRDAQLHGVVYVPDDRRNRGIIPSLNVWKNVGFRVPKRYRRAGITRGRALVTDVAALAERLQIKTSSLRASILSLSGGNQQKAVLARALMEKPTVLLLHEPAQGIDTMGKAELYATLRRLAADGVSILYVATDVEELHEVVDRVCVVSRGRIVASLEGRDITEAQIAGLLAASDANTGGTS
mgnify:CR=1 FL=1